MIVCGSNFYYFRILCTHHIQFLQEADIVVVLNNGTIKHCGPPSEVLPLVTTEDDNNETTTKLKSDTKQV